MLVGVLIIVGRLLCFNEATGRTPWMRGLAREVRREVRGRFNEATGRTPWMRPGPAELRARTS